GDHDDLAVVALLEVLAFLFSSRRRHTRCYRDWSSDVCSSDLLSASSDRLNMKLELGAELAESERRRLASYEADRIFELVRGAARSEERRVGEGGGCGGWGDQRHGERAALGGGAARVARRSRHG